MISYLIDTDWIIDFLKGKKEIVNKLTSLIDEGLSVSIISLAELYRGKEKMSDLQQSIIAFS